MATKVEKPKHLRDLFTTGKLVTIKIPHPNNLEEVWEYDIWLQKPSVTEQEEAASKARAKAARMKATLRDKDSDEYLILIGDTEGLSRDELKRRVIEYETGKLKSQAFNEVMYDDDYQIKDEEGKPLYGKDATGYADLMMAISNRMEEIDAANMDIPEDERRDRWASFEDDEELQKLYVARDEVEKATDERYQVLYQHQMRELEGIPTAELQSRLVALYRETTLNLEWFQVYNSEMLWRACRYPDDHKKKYFSSPGEITDLPRDVVEYLLNQYESLSMTGVDVKN